MAPLVLSVSPDAPEPEPIARAAALIRGGRLVAFPTETVYGLGADALDPAAIALIFAAKGRPQTNPLIVHVPDADEARSLVTEWPDAAERLAERFWPGPLTLILPKRDVVPAAVTAGLAAVAVRVPAHPVALALLTAAERPIAAPSANRYTLLSPTRAEHVERGLGDRVDLILDGGPTDVGIESTVLDLSGKHPVLLRPGMVPADAIERVIGPVERAAASLSDDAARLSPGLAARHYAPAARVVLVDRAREGEPPGTLIRQMPHPVALLVFGSSRSEPLAERVIAMPPDPETYARSLYETLHALDAEGFRTVLVERLPDDDEWAGVRDRLERAAHVE
ncbi:MAG: L-threonylcarbamoyladenylate synthase [Gemmatimonadota bacterium]|nr:L-threonylcarbamoyladenylate synthase [Gemmatimonadota bacterium]